MRAPASRSLVVAGLILACLQLTQATAKQKDLVSSREQWLQSDGTHPDPQPIPGHEEYLLVIRDTGNGVINSKGRLIIPPIYRSDISYVGMGRFVGRKYNRAGGEDELFLLNDDGKILTKLPPETDSCIPYREGILRIGYDEKMTYVNLRGDQLFKPGAYSYGSDFSCGLARVWLNSNSKQTKRKKNGSKIYQGTASCDRMIVNPKESGNSTLAYINKHGKIALGPYQNTEGYPFINSLAIIGDLDGNKTVRAGVIDKTGKFVIPKIYDSISTADGKHFFARKDGKSFVLSSRNQILEHFPDNCLQAKFPDVLEETSLIACQFSVPENGVNELRWGYCDRKGKIAIPPRYDFCSWTGKDTFDVSIKDVDDYATRGIIDRNGNWIKKPEFLSTATTDQLSKMWKMNSPQQARIFCQLLNRCYFIGMTELELRKLLGDGNLQVDDDSNAGNHHLRSYDLMPGSICGYMAQHLKFRVKDGVVTGWLTEGISLPRKIAEEQKQWITQNVIPADLKKGLQVKNLVAKENPN